MGIVFGRIAQGDVQVFRTPDPDVTACLEDEIKHTLAGMEAHGFRPTELNTNTYILSGLPKDRKEYINKIKPILKDNGILFLKCFSDKEPMQEGPYKFSQDEIRDLFSESFRIDSIKETVYQGTLDPFPKAFIVVMINQQHIV